MLRNESGDVIGPRPIAMIVYTDVLLMEMRVVLSIMLPARSLRKRVHFIQNTKYRGGREKRKGSSTIGSFVCPSLLNKTNIQVGNIQQKLCKL